MFLALLLAAAVTTSHPPAKAGAKAHKPAAAAAHKPKKPAPPPFDPADPLGPAKVGWIQCYDPDTAHKTCGSLSTYRDNGDGTYANIAAVLISSNPPAILQTITPVSVQAGAVCGEIKPEDITAGTLTLNGSLYAADAAAPILAKIQTAMSSLYGHQICTTYAASGKDLTATVTFDGQPHPPDSQVRWVSPDDGYHVAPPPAPKAN